MPRRSFRPRFRERGEAAVSGVDVQPDSLRAAEVRDFRQRIDRAGAARSGVGAYRDGIEAGGPVRGHRLGECLHVQPETPIAGDQAHMLRLDTNDPGGPDLGTVTLVTHVDGRLRAAHYTLPSRHEGRDRGHGATAGKESACTLRIAHPLPYPVDDHELELAGTARREPGALVDLVSGDQEVGQHPRPGGGRGNEAEKAGVIDARRERHDLPRGLDEDFTGRPAILRGGFQELVPERLLEVSLPGALPAKVLPPGHQELGDLIRQLQHLFAVHLQTGTGLRAGSGFRGSGLESVSGLLPRGPAHSGNLSATSLPGRPTCTTTCCRPSWL